MRTLYLHIGTHKTGTTALQKFFTLNEEVLAAQGVCYPMVGRNGLALAHHDIANALKGPPFPLRPPEVTVEEFAGGLADCFERYPRILLSSEAFMRFVPEFRDRLPLDLSMLGSLRRCAERTVVVIYLRRQDEYLESFYAQEIRHDTVMSFADFVSARAPDYLVLCRQLAAAFGEENVVVRPYEQGLFTGGSLFSDFLSLLGIDQGEQFAVPEGDINPSLLPDEREFKRLVNALGLSIRELIQFNEPLLQRSEARRNGEPPADAGYALFTNAQRFALRQHCAPINRQVAADFMQLDPGGWPRWPDHQENSAIHKGAYPGLSDASLADIVGDLQSRVPGLLALLSRGVSNALDTRDELAKNSASRFKGVLG